MDSTITHIHTLQNHQPKDCLNQVYKADARVTKASTITSIIFTTPTTGVCKSSDGKREYQFSLPDFCECPDCQIRNNKCKHLVAAETKANEHNRTLTTSDEMVECKDLVQSELLE
jgi:predicted nucleic acid-binding Zn finger protein